MKMTHRGLARFLMLAVLTSPLLATGSCLTIAETSVINGFFNVVTPLLVDQARQSLGLTTQTTDTTATSPSAGG